MKILVNCLIESYYLGVSLDRMKDHSLSLEEENIVIFILNKKFIFNETELAIAVKTKPKSENKWKFVIKKSIKYLKKKVKYNSDLMIKGEKIEDEKLFFNYYFERTALDLEIPIERFYLPNSKLRKIQKQSNEIQTVKKSYIKLLCCSE